MIRPGGREDVRFLRDMLRHAYYWRSSGTEDESGLHPMRYVENFIAVLNPPQVAILAVGAIEERPVAQGGDLVVRPLMSLTLTCDHRAVDGAAAAEFLRELKTLLEEPGLAL